MFSYFERNFIEKFLWESGLSNLVTWMFSQNENSFLNAILKQYIFKCRIMVVLAIYGFGASFQQKSVHLDSAI